MLNANTTITCDHNSVTELFHRLIDLPFTTLILEVQERFRNRDLSDIIDHKVIEFASYVTANKSDGGKWICASTDSKLAHSIDKLSVSTTRVS